MKSVPQIGGKGCIQACVASLLEMSLDEVPAFHECTDADGEPDIHWALQAWLYDRGLWFLEVALPANFPWIPVPYPALCLLIGELKSGTRHAIIGRVEGDQFCKIFDPLPSGGGLTTVAALGFILPRDPASYNRMGVSHEAILKLCEKNVNPTIKTIKRESLKALGLQVDEEPLNYTHST